MAEQIIIKSDVPNSGIVYPVASQANVNAAALVLADGDVFSMGGIDYKLDSSASYIPNLSGVTFAKKPIYVMAWGQSNTRGHSSSKGGDMTTYPDILFWNGDYNAAGTGFVSPVVGTYPLDVLNVDGVTYANNAIYAAARELRETTGRPVFVAFYARGSQPVQSFLTDADLSANGWTRPASTSNIAQYLLDGASAMLAACPDSPTTFDHIFSIQGEANKDDVPATFNAMVKAVYDRFETQGFYDRIATRVVAGGLIDTPELKNWRIAHMLTMWNLTVTMPTMRYLSVNLLPIASGETLHFTGEALVRIGKGMAAKAMSAQDDDMRLTLEGDFVPEVADAVTGGNRVTSFVTKTGTFNVEYRMVYNVETMRPAGIGGTVECRVWMQDLDVTGLVSGNTLRIRNLPFISRAGSSAYSYNTAIGTAKITSGDGAFTVASPDARNAVINYYTTDAVRAQITPAKFNGTTNRIDGSIKYDLKVGTVQLPILTAEA